MRPRADDALAVVGRGPSIRLTPAAVESIGNPTHVVLLFDRQGQRIGVRASESDVRYAFPLKRYSGTVANVSAGGFLNWAGIDHSRRTEYPVDKVDDCTIAFSIGDGVQSPGELVEYRFKNIALADLIPNVSISRTGNITFNRPTMDLIDSAERVVLLYNAAERLIGLRPAKGERHARPIRPSTGQGTWTLSAEGFLKQFRIPHDKGRSYEPRLENGVLIVALDHPKPARISREGTATDGSGA